jgi:hypothetical protein
VQNVVACGILNWHGQCVPDLVHRSSALNTL